MAQRLVEEMVEPWRPEQYHDEYRDELMAAIRRKAESGEAKPTAEVSEPEEAGKAKVSDLMTLLKQSVARASGEKPRRSHKTA
jgi:DNA end-binding protein Ku